MSLTTTVGKSGRLAGEEQLGRVKDVMRSFRYIRQCEGDVNVHYSHQWQR